MPRLQQLHRFNLDSSSTVTEPLKVVVDAGKKDMVAAVTEPVTSPCYHQSVSDVATTEVGSLKSLLVGSATNQEK